MDACWVGLNYPNPILQFVHQPKVTVCMYSLQHCFPFDDTLLHSGDICDQLAKLSEIAQIFLCYWAARVLGMDPKFLIEYYKSGSSSNTLQSLVAIVQTTSEAVKKKRKI